jgi:hypothetical protein
MRCVAFNVRTRFKPEEILVAVTMVPVGVVVCVPEVAVGVAEGGW